MIIVAGHLQVAPEDRTDYLDGCREVVRLARATPGCLDFALSADPLEPGRVNVFERWRSAEDVEAFRGAGPEGPDAAAPIAADVEQYEVRTRFLL
jgi:quinol monooxygenase YgiN